MRYKRILLGIVTALAVVACSGEKSEAAEGGSHAHHHDIAVCGKCGHEPGTTDCCDADAAKCGCGAIKGSAGCCAEGKQFPTDDFALCGNCKQVKGSEKCCGGDTSHTH